MRGRLGSLCAVLLALAVVTPMAAATGPKHPLIETIRTGLPDAAPNTAKLKDPCGVAVDSKGFVYVANYYHRSIYVFDDKTEPKPPEPADTHSFVREFANVDPFEEDSDTPEDGPCGLAFDAADNLYVNNYHRDVVRFTASPPGSTNYSVDAVIDAKDVEDVKNSTSVAVDPTTDRVYVTTRTYVAEYEPPVVAGEEPARKIGLGTLGDGYGVAVSDFAGTPEIPGTDGWIYVADAADNTIKVYDPSVDPLSPIQTISGAGTPRGFFHLTDADLAVDPADGHLYVTDNLQPGFEHPELTVHEFSARGFYRGRLPFAATEGSSTNEVNATPSAVAVAGEEIFITSGNFDDAKVLVFGPAPPIATRILDVQKTGTGAGTVARTPGGWLLCGGACEAELDFQSTLQLNAIPDPHNRFVAWSGCPLPNGSSCVVKMDDDVSVGAEFEPIPQQALAVETTGAGSVISTPAGIECGSGCDGEFDEGSTVTLTAIAAAGSRLASWSGCDAVPTASTCTVTMGGARSVSAAFEPLPPPPPPPPPPPTPLQQPALADLTLPPSVRGAFRVRRREVRGTKATVTGAVPAAGTLAANGVELQPVKVFPFGAGQVSLRLRLNSYGLRELRRAGSHGLPVRVFFSFTPLDGGERVVTATTVVFGQRSGAR